MNKNEILSRLSTPLSAPPYPMPPYYFKDREILYITYRTDYRALRRIVPEPLEIDKDKPYVKFEFLKMNDATGLGKYMESGQVIPVRFHGEEGDYYDSMYVDNFPAIASGRELSAYPKKLGKPSLFVDNDTLVGTLDYGSLRVATATMGYKTKKYGLEKAKQEIMRPIYMLKMIVGYQGDYMRCDLTRSSITEVIVKEAWEGPARLQLFEHVNAPMADLPVLEIISATHYLTDLVLSGGQPVYDYLKEK